MLPRARLPRVPAVQGAESIAPTPRGSAHLLSTLRSSGSGFPPPLHRSVHDCQCPPCASCCARMPSSPALATFPPTPALPITRAARSRQSRDEDADAAMYESDDEQGDDQEHLLSSKARLRRPSLGAAASSRFRMMHPIALAGAVVLATSLATLLYRYNPSFHTFATLSASRPGVLVGRRDSAPLYRGCTFDEFLADLKVAKIRDDAPSRDVVDYTPTPTRELPPFRGFSFNLPNCPLPHVFSQAQACDVLSSFGNIAIAGDSFMRHIWDALLLLLQRKSFSSLAPFPTAGPH